MDSLLTILTAWMPQQRWYAAKASAPRLRLLADTSWPTGDDDARVRVLHVADHSSEPPVVYQVPVVERADVTVAREHVVGSVRAGTVLVDGPHDAAYTRALLARLAPRATAARSEVLTGEQSNTSIVYRPASAPPMICKVFRQVHAGLNPDIELQRALDAAGSAHIPHVIGDLEGRWPDPADATRSLAGSLAFAQEFLAGAEDAWRLARRAAAADAPFTTAARALGATTADVHLTLAHALPTAPMHPAARVAVTDSWRRRLRIATEEIPALAAHRSAIEAVYAGTATAPWPGLQRIHGDFHLGQVLQVPGRGWMLLDFEGEPMRPIAERRLPDVALRDVAGMLRSFDYVAGSLRADRDTATPLDRWSGDARRAFLDGYEQRSGHGTGGPLLRALELDKAVYEAIYEARNRPTWLEIPLRAIDRLTA